MKFLYKPVKPWFLGQRFGENMLPFYKELGLKGHNGLDLGTYRGQPVYAAAEGKVIEVSTDPKSGLGVCVWTKVGKRYFKHIYWHFMGTNVTLGQEVEVGDLLGWADSTGMSTGDHLHFGLKETDQNQKTLNKKNGYNGALDVEPFLFSGYALDAAPVIKKLKQTLADFAEVLAEKIRSL